MPNVSEPAMKTFAGKRVKASRDMRLDGPPQAVFPLLCPVREYDWIEHWRCVMVHSESGKAEKGCTFLTDFPGRGRETWTCTRYEPDRRIEYLRVHPERTIALEIALEPHPASDGVGTLVHWTVYGTGLCPEGNRWLEQEFLPRFPIEAELIERMLAHYLAHGMVNNRALPTRDHLDKLGLRPADD